MKTFKLRVTVPDLRGRFGDNYDCPIARALKRYTGKPMIVGGVEAGFSDKKDGDTFNVFTFSEQTSDKISKKADGIGKRVIVIELKDHRKKI